MTKNSLKPPKSAKIEENGMQAAKVMGGQNSTHEVISSFLDRSRSRVSGEFNRCASKFCPVTEIRKTLKNGVSPQNLVYHAASNNDPLFLPHTPILAFLKRSRRVVSGEKKSQKIRKIKKYQKKWSIFPKIGPP